MIREVSALRTVPAKVGRIIKKSPATSTKHPKVVDDLVKDKLSYVIHAERNDTVDPFMREHFDYLRYLGVRD